MRLDFDSVLMVVKAMTEKPYSNENTLVALHNIMCEHHNRYDDIIYSIDDFNDIMQGESLLDIACKIFYGDFNPNDNYFAFNGYANLISFGYAKYLPDFISAYDITEDIIENPDEYSDYFTFDEE